MKEKHSYPKNILKYMIDLSKQKTIVRSDSEFLSGLDKAKIDEAIRNVGKDRIEAFIEAYVNDSSSFVTPFSHLTLNPMEIGVLLFRFEDNESIAVISECYLCSRSKVTKTIKNAVVKIYYAMVKNFTQGVL